MNIYDYLKLEEQKSVPIYVQLTEGFRRFCSEQPEGTPLPPERELCEKLGISRTALRHALAECAEKGWLLRKWAKGIFVAPKQTAKRIIVLMPERTDITMPWNYIVPGIEDRCSELGVMVEKIPVVFLRGQSEEQLLAFLKRENFSGILHMDYLSWVEAREIQALLKCSTPVLFPHACLRWSRKLSMPMTIVDEPTAFRMAAQVLVAHGHRRFLTIHTDSEYDSIRGFSPEEYAVMLGEIGADSSPELVIASGYDQAEVAEKVHRKLDGGEDFSAILCFSDFFAIMAMEALRTRGLRVPEDISIMGFCGFPGGEYLTPALSTIDFNYRKIGRNAVDRVLGLPDDRLVHYSDYSLVMRESVVDFNCSNRKESAE